MNIVYDPREIYTIQGDMCYDNKVMMVSAPSVITLDDDSPSGKIGMEKINGERRTALEKFRASLRIPILLDIFITILVIVSVAVFVLFVEFGVIPDGNLGFICKDPNISYPFRGDTVTLSCVLISACVGPIVLITLVEILKEHSFKKVRVGTVWNYYKECVFGVLCVIVITEVIKVIVGEPRPHFLDSCQPDMNKICKEGDFILDYNCTNTGLSLFFRTDLTKSFPSGHASLSTFIALYCSYLIKIRIPSKSVSFLTKPFLILVCLTWSLFCSLSRITDRRHHWWDVLAGAILGICGAVYTLSLLHKKEQRLRIQNSLSRSSTKMTVLTDDKSKDITSVQI